MKTINLDQQEQKLITQCIKSCNVDNKLDLNNPINSSDFKELIDILIKKTNARAPRDEVFGIECEALKNIKASYLSEEAWDGYNTTESETRTPPRKIAGSKY